MKIKRSGGFTIIEVLVAMVILAIGVLGLGVLQLSSMQNTQSGQMRSQASILAYNIIDSMRANTPSVTAGNYNRTSGAGMPIAANCYGAQADCSVEQLAASDLVQWLTALDNRLPSGDGAVATFDAGTRTQVTVRITWVDPYTAAGGAEQIVVVTEIPR